MRNAICLLLPSALLLTACNAQPVQDETGNLATDQAPAPIGNETATPAPNEAAGAPDFSPPPLTAEAERGVTGARNVMLSFARAIEERAFGQAWAMLGPADKQRWSQEEFAGLFGDLSDITVAVPDGTTEGAAGSIYYTAPVAITGADREGRPIRMEGEAVLRRVNDVEGATPAQLRWHFETLTLDWTH